MTEMYRFLLRPRWLVFHLVVVTAIVVMINLGFWQLRRLDERQEFNDTVEARIDEPAVSVGELVVEPGFEPTDAEWRPVTTSGTYLPGQILVFNRSQGGRAGDNVLTALQQDDGSIVLVNRGFVPLGADVPDPPATAVKVTGLARPSQVRRTGGLTDAGEGPVSEVRRIDIGRIAPQFGVDVEPVYVDLVTSVPAVGPTDPTPLPLPELDSGPHLSYAIQWFIFAVCVAIGWVLAVRRSTGRRRRAQVRAEADRPGEAGFPTSAGLEATRSPTGTGATSPG